MRTAGLALVLLLLLSPGGLGTVVPARAEEPAPSEPPRPGAEEDAERQRPPPPADAEAAVAFLAGQDELHGEHIGYAGQTTATYVAYTVLREGASLERLAALRRHESPLVRVYAAWARLERLPPARHLDIVLEHLGDDARLTGFPGGCCGWEASVADWVIEHAQVPDEDRRTLQVRVVEHGGPESALVRTLEQETLPPTLRARLHELLDRGVDSALVALARIGDPEDFARIRDALEAEAWSRLAAGLRALRVRPVPSLFSALAARHADFTEPTADGRPRYQNARLYDKALEAYDTEEAARLRADLARPR